MLTSNTRRLFVGTLIILLATALQSWTITPCSRQATFYTFIERSCAKNFENHLARTQFENFVSLKNIHTNAGLKKLRGPYVIIHYQMSQLVTPYKDANLVIYAENPYGTQNESDALFWNGSGTFTFMYTQSVDVSINCPIYDQWDARGYYILLIQEYDSITNTYTKVAEIRKPFASDNTPDSQAINWSGTLTGISGEFYITLESV